MRMEMGIGMGALLPSMHTPVHAHQRGHTRVPMPRAGRRPSSPELPVGRQLMGGVITEQPCVPIQQVDIDMLLGRRETRTCVQTCAQPRVCISTCAHPQLHTHTNTPLHTHSHAQVSTPTCTRVHRSHPAVAGGPHGMALAQCPATTSTRIRATITLGVTSTLGPP